MPLCPTVGCCIVTDMTTTPPPGEPIRPGAARDAVMTATRDAGPKRVAVTPLGAALVVLYAYAMGAAIGYGFSGTDWALPIMALVGALVAVLAVLAYVSLFGERR